MYVHYVTLFRDIKDIATTSLPMWQRTLKKMTHFKEKNVQNALNLGSSQWTLKKQSKILGVISVHRHFY